MHDVMFQVLESFQRFFATTRSQHFVVYMPYTGERLLDFLSTCMHQHILDYLMAEGFVQTALFTDRKEKGHAALLFSHMGVPNKVGLQESQNLQMAGLFDRAFCMANMTSMLCYVFSTNTLLVEANDFYIPGMKNTDEYSRKMGADWIAAVRAAMDGYYDHKKAEFTEEKLSHSCQGNPWCLGHTGTRPELEWSDLFPAPWNNPSDCIIDMMPYRVMTVLADDFKLGNPVIGPHFNPRRGNWKSLVEREDPFTSKSKINARPLDKFRPSLRSSNPSAKTRSSVAKALSTGVVNPTLPKKQAPKQALKPDKPSDKKADSKPRKEEVIDISKDQFADKPEVSNSSVLNMQTPKEDLFKTLLNTSQLDPSDAGAKPHKGDSTNPAIDIFKFTESLNTLTMATRKLRGEVHDAKAAQMDYPNSIPHSSTEVLATLREMAASQHTPPETPPKESKKEKKRKKRGHKASEAKDATEGKGVEQNSNALSEGASNGAASSVTENVPVET